MEKQAPITRQELIVVVGVIFAAFAGSLGIDIHLASLPAIMTYMHTDKTHVQQSVSIFLLGVGGSLLFYGPLSDKIGRKPVVIFGLCLATLSSFATAFTHTIGAFLFLRLIQGVGTGVCTGLGRIIVADILQGERFATLGSYFGIFVGLSPLFGPVIGGYIQQWFGWQTNFIALGFILLIPLLFIIFFCPETNQHKNPKAISVTNLLKNYGVLFTHPLFIGSTLISGLALSVTMVYASVSPFIFQVEYQLTPVDYGWITASIGIASMVGRFITPKIVQRIGVPRTTYFGSACLLASGALLCIFQNFHILHIFVLLILVFMAVLSFTFIMPCVASIALSPYSKKRGTAGALYGSSQMLIAFGASSIASSIEHSGIKVLALCYLVLGLLCCIIYRILIRNRAT